ncbi:MAG: T9SS type A sorting domain-containing protein [Candidatus Cloacimonetes bacterium]|nr:T9SS type A sorting domain-containing protein [Candidatus Cloacimonadota bacterium]
MSKLEFLILILFIIFSNLYGVYHKVGGLNTMGGLNEIKVINNIAYTSNYSHGLEIFDIECYNNPQLLSSLDLDDHYHWIEVYENYCFINRDDSTVIIIDIGDVNNPFIIEEFSFSTADIRAICVKDDYIYLYLDNEIQIVDISNPQYPTLISTCNIPEMPSITYSKLVIKESLLLIGTFDGLYLYDISNPLFPFMLNFHDTPRVYDIEIENDNIFISYSDGLEIININDLNIQVVSKYYQYNFYDILVDGNLLYANASNENFGGFHLFDISDFDNIYSLGSYGESGSIISVRDNIVFLNTHNFNQADAIFVDVSDPENENYLGEVNYLSSSRDLDSNDNIIGVCSGENDCMNLFDISDPQNPIWLFSHGYGYTMELHVSTVTLYDDFAFAGFSGSYYDNTRFNIYDISDPQNIVNVGGNEIDANSVKKIVAQDDYAYAGCNNGLHIIDINDLTNPLLVYIYDIGYVQDLEARSNMLYCCSSGGLKIVDISNPEALELIGSWESNEYRYEIKIYDDYAYMPGREGGLKIIDITDPTNPFLVNTILPHYDSIILSKPIIRDDKLILSDVCWNEILTYDLSDPAFPILIDSFRWNLPSFDITATEDYLVTANGSFGFTILDFVGVTPVSNQLIEVNNINLVNYPNPFNPETTIYFETTNLHELAQIEIYNIKGQKVRTIDCHTEPVEVSNGSNTFSVTWNGTDQNEQPVASGIYFYQLNMDNKVIATKKCLLLK